MKNPWIITILVAIVIGAAAGGGTYYAMKTEQAGLETELVECQQAKVQSEAQVISWEQRFDLESNRWATMEASITDQLPKALSELHEERENIIEMVPEQVRAEIGAYLDEYRSTVMTGFEALAGDSKEIKLQLDTTQRVLESLGSDTQAIQVSIDGALAEEREKRVDERQQREEIAAGIGQLGAVLAEFDSTHINCKKCPERLKLNRKEREAITAFHLQLSRSISDLQAAAAQ
jgi:hypothetical protein